MTQAHQTARPGRLVADAFDGAAPYSNDPEVAPRLVARAVMRVLRRTRLPLILPSPSLTQLDGSPQPRPNDRPDPLPRGGKRTP